MSCVGSGNWDGFITLTTQKIECEKNTFMYIYIYSTFLLVTNFGINIYTNKKVLAVCRKRWAKLCFGNLLSY
jgi:hypothetical protein